MPTLTRRAFAAALLAACPLAFAQPESQPQQSQDAPPAFDLSKLPAPVLLGLRAETVRRSTPVVEDVVIVPSREAFVDALSRWTTNARFPILLDDDTPEARENIARFVRAFKPKRVLRWEGENVVWAQSIEAQRQIMADAVAKAWGADDFASLPSAWNEVKFVPPGVVILSESDPLCLGGLALAAGRGQIPLWLTRDADSDLPAEFSGELTEEQASAFRAEIERQLDQVGLPWNELGDTIDVLTIAVTLPGRISSELGRSNRTSPIVALSDYLGRGADGDRYAFTGLLVGDEQQAAYASMCSLFLQPSKAWMFNGYKADGVFANYDPTPARQPLADAGIEPTIDVAPFSGVQHWRRRAMRGIDAGFIHVNSSGMARNFNLNPGAATSAEIPVLNTPAIVHFVHSFSAQNVGDRRTIARRFLDHGAYAYVGSVDEPFLTAFQPPEQLLRRMFARAPLGAAARHDSAPIWKINIYGDPLTSIGEPAPRAEESADLPGATTLDSAMRDALQSREFAVAANALVLLGRDADAVRLYNAVRTNPDSSVPPALAEAAFSALFRTGDREALVHAASVIPARTMRNSPMQDMLWAALVPASSFETPTNAWAAVLRDNVRNWNLVEDAEQAAAATAAAQGPQLARAFLERLINDTENERGRTKLRELLGRY